jgi:hypothetical protein
LNANEVLITVFILNSRQKVVAMLVDRAYFSVLSRYFNFVYFAVLKFGQIMAQHCERLKARTGIQKRLVSIPPLLESLYIFVMSRFTC